MKRILLILGMVLFLSNSFGQSPNDSAPQSSNYTSHYSGETSISLIPSNIFLDSYEGSYIGGGLKLRLFVGKRFSFDSDLILGHDFAHFGLGIIGLPLWYIGLHSGFNFNIVDEQSLKGLLVLGAIMILSGEHFAYHFPVANATDISPYISLLRFKQLKNEQDTVNPDGIVSTTGCAIGIEINQYFRKFIISPYIDYEKTYGIHGYGFNIGISVGITLQNK